MLEGVGDAVGEGSQDGVREATRPALCEQRGEATGEVGTEGVRGHGGVAVIGHERTGLGVRRDEPSARSRS